MSEVLKAIIQQTKIDPAAVEDIQIGNVLQAGASGLNARMAAFLAGFPISTTGCTVNRLCSSGLQAIANVAN